MRQVIIACMVFGVSLTAMGAGAPKTTDAGENAFKVNGVGIKKKTVVQVADALKMQASQIQPEMAARATAADFRKGAVSQLMANELLLGEARAKGIVFSAEKVNKAFAEFKGRMGEERFAKELRDAGRTEEELRKQIRDGMILDSLIKTLVRKSDTVSTADCQAFYKANDSLFTQPGRMSARQITVAVKTGAPAAERETARKKAESLLAQLRNGKEFTALVKSETAGNVTGGDLGWFAQGDLMAQIDSAVIPLKVNQYSGVVTSPAGYHVIQKTDEESGKRMAFNEARDQIRMTLEFQRRSGMIQKYVDELKKKAKIEYSDSSFVPDDRPGKQ